MKKTAVAVIAALCVLTVPSMSVARKTYSLAEIEAMNKAGKFTGTERFVIIRGKEATAITGDKTEISMPETETETQNLEETLIPEPENAVEEQALIPAADEAVEEEIQIPAPEEVVEEETLVPEPEVTVEELTPIPEPVASTVDSEPMAYDKVTRRRFLITMAREYYGNGDFWVYIYEENKAKLGHPDRITPGTDVLIPDLKKYGVDPGNASDVEKAKKLGREIYGRYSKRS